MLPSDLVPLAALDLPTQVTTTSERAMARFLDFFTSNICNPNTSNMHARGLVETVANENWIGVLESCQSLSNQN